MDKDISFHDQVKRQILLACQTLGLQAKEEYKGMGWRADVFVNVGDTKYAFEVQIAQQTHLRTLERQEKYKKENIIGCWLFEREPAGRNQEMEDPPLFKVINNDGQVYVSLKDRKTLPLNDFVKDYLQDAIKFCNTLNPLPIVDIVFMEMSYWKCGAENHIYYIAPFKSACNTEIRYDEVMWVSDKLAFHPEIIKNINEYTDSEQGKHIKIGGIKERYSHTVEKSYMSFGCAKCDSIFGDWFVQEATMQEWYAGGTDRISFPVSFDLNLREDIPHWCHPGDHEFCEQ